MNKSDLIEGVVADCGTSKVQAERVVDGIFGRIEEALRNGDSLVLRDFGTLKVHERPAGKGRNPRTGETVTESIGRLERAMRASLDAGPFVISGGGYAPPGQPAHQSTRRTDKQRGHSRKHAGFNDRWDAMSRAEQQAKGAQLRSVWWLPTANYPEGHFAVMPEEMAAICILAGCPTGGTVLDPFAGAGTSLFVADRLGRSAIGIELNPDFAAMCERRVREPGFAFADIAAG